jgi:Cu(I)/Ag(I) efflux system membrane fusion protein
MYATVAIDAAGSHEPTLMVPYSAVLDSGTKQFVLVDRSEGRFEPRSVRLGTHSDNFVEVRDGLKIGDRVVTSANFLIDAESNLRAALQGFSGGDKPKSSQTGTKP